MACSQPPRLRETGFEQCSSRIWTSNAGSLLENFCHSVTQEGTTPFPADQRFQALLMSGSL
jgi:hypothetical protein